MQRKIPTPTQPIPIPASKYRNSTTSLMGSFLIGAPPRSPAFDAEWQKCYAKSRKERKESMEERGEPGESDFYNCVKQSQQIKSPVVNGISDTEPFQKDHPPYKFTM